MSKKIVKESSYRFHSEMSSDVSGFQGQSEPQTLSFPEPSPALQPPSPAEDDPSEPGQDGADSWSRSFFYAFRVEDIVGAVPQSTSDEELGEEGQAPRDSDEENSETGGEIREDFEDNGGQREGDYYEDQDRGQENSAVEQGESVNGEEEEEEEFQGRDSDPISVEFGTNDSTGFVQGEGAGNIAQPSPVSVTRDERVEQSVSERVSPWDSNGVHSRSGEPRSGDGLPGGGYYEAFDTDGRPISSAISGGSRNSFSGEGNSHAQTGYVEVVHGDSVESYESQTGGLVSSYFLPVADGMSDDEYFEVVDSNDVLLRVEDTSGRQLRSPSSTNVGTRFSGGGSEASDAGYFEIIDGGIVRGFEGLPGAPISRPSGRIATVSPPLFGDYFEEIDSTGEISIFDSSDRRVDVAHRFAQIVAASRLNRMPISSAVAEYFEILREDRTVMEFIDSNGATLRQPPHIDRPAPRAWRGISVGGPDYFELTRDDGTISTYEDLFGDRLIPPAADNAEMDADTTHYFELLEDSHVLSTVDTRGNEMILVRRKRPQLTETVVKSSFRPICRQTERPAAPPKEVSAPLSDRLLRNGFGEIEFLVPVFIAKFNFEGEQRRLMLRTANASDYCPARVRLFGVWPVDILSPGGERRRPSGPWDFVQYESQLAAYAQEKGWTHERYLPQDGVWMLEVDFLSDYPVTAP
jgi:hypothetical protein